MNGGFFCNYMCLDLDFFLITQMLNVLCLLNLSTSFDRRLGKLLS